MTKIKIALSAAVLAMSVASYTASARAETAHNAQTGANTTNSYDTAASAVLKQHN
ncbi:MAG TPA: hypothetical protein VH414_04010 [Lichenihabitans sp.]|jgi:hypothetical protein|nr:hypothetical protein [Lichenihabitans sp.]